MSLLRLGKPFPPVQAADARTARFGTHVSHQKAQHLWISGGIAKGMSQLLCAGIESGHAFPMTMQA